MMTMGQGGSEEARRENELMKTARMCSFVNGSVSRFLGHVADGVGRWFAVSGGWRRWGVVLAFIGSRVPCPLGRGIM